MAGVAKPISGFAGGRRDVAFVLAVLLVPAAVLVAGSLGELTVVKYRAATAPVNSNVTLLARLDGRLFGQANLDGTVCFWVGNAKDLTALSWPWGYTARASLIGPLLTLMDGRSLSRLEVDDASGRRVAAFADDVTLAGGTLPEDVKSITGCSGFRQFFAVGKVTGVGIRDGG